MYPWFWFWAPQFQFPFSGSVAQRIAPDTDWFFGAIRPQAGNGDMEQRVHEDVASYGRQLGLVTEVLLSLASGDAVQPGQARASLERLKAIHAEIEALKVRERAKLAQSAADMLQQLAAQDPAAFAQLLQRFAQPQQPLLGHAD